MRIAAIVRTVGLLAPSVALMLAVAAPSLAAERSMQLCLDAIAQEERRHTWLPGGLLTSIAMVESAHRPNGQTRTVPWPWTINSPKGAFYLASRNAAVAKVEDLRRQGVRNIDVGCMQVNLMHHPHAFRNLRDAFDPTTNVRYATRFLAELNRDARSMFQAVGRYHSGTPRLAQAYAERVYARWGQAPEIAATPRSRHGLGAPDSARILDGLTSSGTAPPRAAATSALRQPSTSLATRNGAVERTVPRATDRHDLGRTADGWSALPR